ncbi:hypothetical protein SND73_06575, partial [Escherichia coli]|nr:hypothetical protein [Escherichia coli]
GPDPRNFNQRVNLGRNDLLIRTFLSTSPNNWLVFMQNGQEVVIDSGKSVSLTLTMAPAFKDEGELTDMTDITGNLTVLVEAK